MLQDLIPILGIVAVFGTGGIVLIAIIVSNYRQRQLRSAEILAAIEKGIEVPFPPPKVKNYRNQGLVWTSLGIALVITMAVGAIFKGAVWALLPLGLGVAFPLGLGVAYLLIARGEKKEAAGGETS